MRLFTDFFRSDFLSEAGEAIDGNDVDTLAGITAKVATAIMDDPQKNYFLTGPLIVMSEHVGKAARFVEQSVGGSWVGASHSVYLSAEQARGLDNMVDLSDKLPTALACFEARREAVHYARPNGEQANNTLELIHKNVEELPRADRFTAYEVLAHYSFPGDSRIESAVAGMREHMDELPEIERERARAAVETYARGHYFTFPPRNANLAAVFSETQGAITHRKVSRKPNPDAARRFVKEHGLT